MSGGHWMYMNDRVADEIFCLFPDYGEKGFKKAAQARKNNPLEDKQLSELAWDLFCVLHSYDWYACGDTCEETYRQDVDYFKKKWLQPQTGEMVRREIDETINEAKCELYKAFGLTIEDQRA